MGANMSKLAICYDLAESPFAVKALGIEFRFSSNVHKKRFERELVKRDGWLSDSFTRRFHMDVQAEVLSVVQLYTQVENRGFYMVVGDRVVRDKSKLYFVVKMGVVNVPLD